MQIGQEVRYYPDGNGEPVAATVLDIVGAGKSLAKRLDLRHRSEGKAAEVEDVPHEGDAEDGEHFWLLKGERRSKPETEGGGADEGDGPSPLAVPDGVPESPSVRKAANKRKG